MAQEIAIPNAPSTAKVRNPLAVALLGLITIGIYWIFWWYFINREMVDYGQANDVPDLGDNPWLSVLAVTIGALVIIPALVSLWRTCRRIETTQNRCAREQQLQPRPVLHPVAVSPDSADRVVSHAEQPQSVVGADAGLGSARRERRHRQDAQRGPPRGRCGDLRPIRGAPAGGRGGNGAGGGHRGARRRALARRPSRRRFRRSRADRGAQAERRPGHEHGNDQSQVAARGQGRAHLPRRDRAPDPPPARAPRRPHPAAAHEQLRHPRRHPRGARVLRRARPGRPAARLPAGPGAEAPRRRVRARGLAGRSGRSNGRRRGTGTCSSRWPPPVFSPGCSRAATAISSCRTPTISVPRSTRASPVGSPPRACPSCPRWWTARRATRRVATSLAAATTAGCCCGRPPRCRARTRRPSRTSRCTATSTRTASG